MVNFIWGIFVGILGEYLFLCCWYAMDEWEEMKIKGERKKMWEKNAYIVETVFGGFVDWDERFYLCPECGEPVYEEDWCKEDLMVYFCPICEFEGEVC